MATKKKDMPKDLDPETPALEDDDVIDDEPEVDDLEADIDEDVLVGLEDDDPLDDDVIVEIDDDDDEVGDEVAEILTASPAAVVERSGEAEDEEEDEEPEEDDVEASLDVILKERLVVEDEPEDDEATDQEDRTEGNERVLPKQPDEFVCRSCFLVKHPSQLADKKKMFCRDCV
ncbi:MAG: DUF4193 family protein [Acidimicrobiales bacterium]